MRAAAAVLLLLPALLLGGCADGDGAAEPVAMPSCTKLLYEGEGKPDLIVVSGFPLRGDAAETTRLMVDAVEFVLRERDFRAGDHRVGFQSCNETLGEELDAGVCRRNARAFVDAADVVGVIGPLNSGCALLQIPIVSRRDAGPLAMVSPSNTYAGLTRAIAGEPEPSGAALYPDGVRSYARVVTHDHAQGIAAAHIAARSGAGRAVILYQKGVDDPYVRVLTTPFVRAANGLGLETTRLEWKLEKRYARLAASVAAARPDVVYLAGLPYVNGKTLIEDLRAALPSGVRLIAPDSFAAPDIARELGRAGEGLLVTLPGIPPEKLPPTGQAFVREFGSAFVERGAMGAPEAAQAAEVLLGAIARSDGTRASVVEELFRTKVENGILGSFSFDRFGDIVPAPVGIYRFEGGKILVDGVIRVPLDRAGG